MLSSSSSTSCPDLVNEMKNIRRDRSYASSQTRGQDGRWTRSQGSRDSASATKAGKVESMAMLRGKIVENQIKILEKNLLDLTPMLDGAEQIAEQRARAYALFRKFKAVERAYVETFCGKHKNELHLLDPTVDDLVEPAVPSISNDESDSEVEEGSIRRDLDIPEELKETNGCWSAMADKARTIAPLPRRAFQRGQLATLTGFGTNRAALALGGSNKVSFAPEPIDRPSKRVRDDIFVSLDEALGDFGLREKKRARFEQEANDRKGKGKVVGPRYISPPPSTRRRLSTPRRPTRPTVGTYYSAAGPSTSSGPSYEYAVATVPEDADTEVETDE